VAEPAPLPFHQTTVFTKRPAPGRVKTRLCPPLSPVQAADLALAMLDDTLERLQVHREYAMALCVEAAPDADAGDLMWFEERYPNLLEVRPQRGAGLGERIANHFADALARRPGSTQVVVGSDAPTLPPARIVTAHSVLAAGDADLVLGPDLGGGYYLVALRAPASELFLEVTMSTDTMYEQTVAAARAMGFSVHELPAHGDVDVVLDLVRLRRELGRDSTCPRTRAWLMESREGR
jgi:rSAM/selenodomain-associated transferase 1